MKNAGKACNNRLYRHIRTFEKIVKNYFVIYIEIAGKNRDVLLLVQLVPPMSGYAKHIWTQTTLLSTNPTLSIH